jgi:hypothetical protein
MTAGQNAKTGAACEDDLDEPSRRRVRPVELSNVGPPRPRATLSRHARCLQRIAKDVAAETRLTFDEVVRTLEAGRLGADEQRVWNAFDRSVLRAACEALPWLAGAMFGGAHKIGPAAHTLAAWTDPDLVDCVISVARRVEREQGTPAVAALQTMLAQGAESPGLVAWRTSALNELRPSQLERMRESERQKGC